MNDKHESSLQKYENAWSNNKDLPHYKYAARPIYKLCGGDKYPLFSVPATFICMDAIFHKLLPYMLWSLFPAEDKDSEQKNDHIFYLTLLSISSTLVWAGLSIPVAIQKYNKNQNNSSLPDPEAAPVASGGSTAMMLREMPSSPHSESEEKQVEARALVSVSPDESGILDPEDESADDSLGFNI